MPPKADLYAALMQAYYRLEESLLAEASAGLASAQTPAASRAVLDLTVSQLRAFLLQALQSQAIRLSEIEEALHVTGQSLGAAQQRMEGMEQENAEAAAILFKMKVRGESQPGSAEAQELAERVIKQERLLQKREGELAALRRQFLEAQSDREALRRRLEAEERRVAALEPAAALPPGPEVEELGRRLQETQAVLLQLRADGEGLVRRLQEAEASALQREVEQAALKAMPRPPDEVPTLRAHLAELERRLSEPTPDVEALRRQLKDEEIFRTGFIQRIHALEAARYRAQEEAKLAAQKIAAAEKVPWAQERAALLGRAEALTQELSRLRAVDENSQREWAETSARQEALRLAEIAGLKRELEKLRPDRRPV